MNKFDTLLEQYTRKLFEAGAPAPDPAAMAAPAAPAPMPGAVPGAPPPPVDPAQMAKTMSPDTVGQIAGDQTVKSLFDNIEKFGTDGFIDFFKSLKGRAQSPLTIKSPDILNFKDKDAMMNSIKSNYKDIYAPLIKFIKLTEDKDGNDILETKYRRIIDEFIQFMVHHKNSTKPVPISPSNSGALGSGGTITP